MNQLLASREIALSEWYACLSTRRDLATPGAQSAPGLSVFNAAHAGALVTAVGPGGIAVLFDGFLFDRRDLQRELALPQHADDATIASAAYRRWGAEIFDRLDGCYLLAVWDPAADRLWLGHDGLGRHPVFYAHGAEGFWFSANVLALAESGRVSHAPNRVSLALAMLAYWPEAEETFFQEIRRLRPGHYLEIGPSGSTVDHAYFDSIPDDDEPYLPDAEARDQFECELTRAVRRCMALEPHGIMLSGGLDSVTVAALASEYQTERGQPALVAVSGRTGGPLSYEERMQSRVCEVLRMPHLVSTTSEWTGGRDGIELSLELTPRLPGPSRIYWVGTYTRFYRRAADAGVPTLLTGAGGDNWLAVAETHAIDLMRRLQAAQLYRFITSDVRTRGATMGNSLRRLLITYGLRVYADSWWARIAPDRKRAYHVRKWRERLPPWLCPDPDLKASLVERLIGRRVPSLTAAGAIPPNYYRHYVRASGNPHLFYEFETGHHIESACGVRLLSPYHDRRLVSFFNRISPRALLHGDRYKGLLRPVVSKRLPQLELEHQRKEYSAETQTRERDSLRGSMERAWSGASFRALESLGVVDGADAQRLGDTISIKDIDALARMFGLLSAETWLRARLAL